MGEVHSKRRPAPAGVAELTRDEKRLVRKSWGLVDANLEQLGAVALKGMFEESPHMRTDFRVFENIDVKDPKYNEVLQRHGYRVLSAVGRVVSVIDNEERYVAYLKLLGSRHYSEYGFVPSYADVMCEYFLRTVRDTLGKDWTPEAEAAYIKLFEIVVFHMKTLS